MKIGFSARGLSIPSGGVKQFILSLLPALARNIGDDELYIFYNRPEHLGLTENCKEVLIRGENRIIWDFLKLPLSIREHKVNVVIFPKNVIPFFSGSKNYAVVHDLAYFNDELGAYPFADTLYMRNLIPQSLRRANGVFAVSAHTKNDIIKYIKCSPEKITVTYEAADTMYKPIEDQTILESVRNKYNLPPKFILYVGSLSPRKNIPRLLDAYHKLRDKIEHKLIFTASKSWKDSQVYNKIEELGLKDRIIKTGYVEHKDMPVLYNLAGLFVYPSLYEGFGLPVLEAMQCGCPVVASNATSIPEVAGDAAVLVDPLDVNAIAEAILKVLTLDTLFGRLITKGFVQASKFSWEN